jgi:hypothetical protein
MKKQSVFFLVLLSMLAQHIAYAGTLCPSAKNIPQLVIQEPEHSLVHTEENWQVFLDNTPISDMQLAELAHSHKHVQALQSELKNQTTWVYVGLGIMALGTALSSTGWALFGKNDTSPGQGVSLSLGLGGIAVGLAGFVTTSHFIRAPMEPFMAPTPLHRLSREEVRTLVAIVNKRLYKDICAAAQMVETAP